MLFATPALAGPPLLCFPFEIGSARSLPIVQTGYGAVDPNYDASRLVADTLDLLQPGTPVIVHMETLRRATLYARADLRLGADLLATLQKRAAAGGLHAAVAVFDFGYLVETFKQAGVHLSDDVDGYVWVQKAIALEHDPQMEFAAAIISAWPKRADHDEHVKLAMRGAGADTMLAANLAGHMGEGDKNEKF